MRIGELAEQAGISTKAIRYYEQIGILTPPARTPSGYRSYDPSALGRLGFVRAAQAVGLTLGEIRQIIAFREGGQAPCAHVTDLLQRHAADLDARIAELQQLRGELRQLAERAATLNRSSARPSWSATSSPDTHRTRLPNTPQTPLRSGVSGTRLPPLGLGPLVGPADDLPLEWPLGVGVGPPVIPIADGQPSLHRRILGRRVRVGAQIVAEQQRPLLREATCPAHVHMGPRAARWLPGSTALWVRGCRRGTRIRVVPVAAGMRPEARGRPPRSGCR